MEHPREVRLRDDARRPDRTEYAAWSSLDARGTQPQKATTCDLCRDVKSAEEEVSCVHACPHEAAFRMSGAELWDRIHS